MPNAEYKQDLDGGFIGFESRTNATLLKPQYLQYSQNVRLERGHVQVRKGAKNFTPPDFIGKPIYSSCKYVDGIGIEYIAIATTDSVLILNPNTGGSISQYYYPAGRTIEATDVVDMFQGIDTLFILRGEPSAYIGCTYLLTAASTTVNVTDFNHGLSTGAEVIISDPQLPAGSRGSFLITKVSNDVFTYVATAAVTEQEKGTFTGTYQSGKPPLVLRNGVVSVSKQGISSGTDSNFPPCSVGMFYGNRLIIKRDRDKIAASDYLDHEHWDLTFGQFTINQGAYDRIVGFTPWADNEFLIFERNSIYRARVENENYLPQSAPDAASYISTVTNAFGAVGPKAIVNAGRFVFFLTDGGIYQLEPQLDLKLINALEPLSAPIHNVIEQIRRDKSANACGIYHNNRLFMAVPRTSAGNDTVLIFNTLNKAWESIDIYPNDTVYGGGQFVIKNFIECTLDERKRLFCLSNMGLFLLEENEEGDEVGNGTGVLLPVNLDFYLSAVKSSSYPINMEMRTRKFTYNTTTEKKFSSLAVECEYVTPSSMSITSTVYNPDSHETADFFSGFGPQDYIRRAGINKRGFACDVTIRTQAGRPIVKSVSIDASMSGRLNKSEQ